jgi:hypothetical protein
MFPHEPIPSWIAIKVGFYNFHAPVDCWADGPVAKLEVAVVNSPGPPTFTNGAPGLDFCASALLAVSRTNSSGRDASSPVGTPLVTEDGINMMVMRREGFGHAALNIELARAAMAFKFRDLLVKHEPSQLALKHKKLSAPPDMGTDERPRLSP